MIIKEPRSHSIPDVKETLKNGTFLQDPSTPSINVAELDFDAFDNYSDNDDDDDDDGYVNDDEMKKAISAVKTKQT